MTHYAHTTHYKITQDIPKALRFCAVFIVIATIPTINPELGAVLYQSMIDTYIGVSAWVGLTLAILYGWENVFKVDFAHIMQKHRRWQPFIAAALGGMPGCGGAIVITTQYARGGASFGSLVATLTATMGDAAFLLIASKPNTALIVIVGGIIVGTITGYIVDTLPHAKRLQQSSIKTLACGIAKISDSVQTKVWKPIDIIWLILLIPAMIMAFVDVSGADTNAIIPFTDSFAIGMATFSLAIFLASPREANPMNLTTQTTPHTRRVVAETCFISAWVLLSFFAYDATMHYMQWDLVHVFSGIAPILPLVAILIGWIPGCGPQIVVTTLYINGLIPFSALMGNAISNDGDALFPALSIAPRAAIWATAYSTVPALIVAYGIYFILGI